MSDTRTPIPNHDCYSVTYWSDTNTRAEPDVATRVAITTRKSSYTNQQDFAWPDDRYAAERLTYMLQRAFEIGDWQARKDIRRALGVTEPRP